MRSADSVPVSQVLLCQTSFEKGKRAVQTCNGVFTIGILGYASRRPLGRRREGRTVGGCAVAANSRVSRRRLLAPGRVRLTASRPGQPARSPRRAGGRSSPGGRGRHGGLRDQRPAARAPAVPRRVRRSRAFAGRGPRLARSLPVSVNIPAIGVSSKLLRLGVNSDGTMQVPSLTTSADEAAWYKYSATPGQIGASVIEGHVDSYHGPAVFFRLGALHPGDAVDVTLADGVTAIFRVTGVREYLKSNFPAKSIYGAPGYAALRLITCGGDFRLCDRSLPQFHCGIRIPRLITPGLTGSQPAPTAPVAPSPSGRRRPRGPRPRCRKRRRGPGSC